MKKKETKKVPNRKKVVKRTTKVSKKEDKKIRKKRINYSPRISKKMLYLFLGIFISFLIVICSICINRYNEKHKKPSLNGSNGIKEVDAPKDQCDDGKYHPDSIN